MSVESSRRKSEALDVQGELAKLKIFQRQTVDYVFQRLYKDSPPARRFLIADEVGLGKTLVARGVVARAVQMLWDRVEQVRVVYICSNADIARQNINRLGSFLHRGTEEGKGRLPRLTLLSVHSALKEKEKLSFIPLTPGTSFNLKHSLGTGKERALLHWLLDEAWGFGGRKPPYNVLQGNMYSDNFRDLVRRFRKNEDLDDSLSRRCIDRLREEKELRERFFALCERFPRKRKYRSSVPEEDKRARNALVGELRSLLAYTSVHALRPSLVVLDEFQRFKSLLTGDDEASILARNLFEYSDEETSARVMLLSATPYKMYTSGDEFGDEDHYADFVQTLDFLVDDEEEGARIRSLLRQYREGLYRVGAQQVGAREKLQHTVRNLACRLRRVMVRTERLANSEDRNGMLEQVPVHEDLSLQRSDVYSYLAYSSVARILGSGGSMLEYWKSCPFLFNFMDNYEVKRRLREKTENGGWELQDVRDRLHSGEEHCLLPFTSWRHYQRFHIPNPRLRYLEESVLGGDMWKMIWLPASHQYYRPCGVFDVRDPSATTKRLVFSAWQVVPKTLASLLSYEAERRMIRSFFPEAENSVEGRRQVRPLLNFTRSKGRLTGMPVFTLLYPSTSLAARLDPLDMACQVDNAAVPSREQAVQYFEHQVEEMLSALDTHEQRQGPIDENWYWAAPVLLDLQYQPYQTKQCLSRGDVASRWRGDEGRKSDENEDMSAWADHVERIKNLVAGEFELGSPPDDLARVIAHIALAAPGTVALRALSRITPSSRMRSADTLQLIDAAARIGWTFRNRFNLPEVTALIRGINSSEPYWRRVLEYCVDGGLQAVVDEYCHVLVEHLGLTESPSAEKVDEVSESMREVLGLRTSVLGVDEVDPASDRFIRRERMRTHFALRFGDVRTDDGARIVRDSQVRAAFNSPFWPFVLTTTSIGQEGLDFHLYCHAVVHWDLPSNPVDLEQREGRVHRYKNHAVRKNVANVYGKELQMMDSGGAGDPWEDMFSQAEERSEDGGDGLNPFWVYAPPGSKRSHIMRLVPAVPLSRDLRRLDFLRRALTLYRMIFGQPRQEDMVDYLTERVPEEELECLLDALEIDLSPPSVS